MADDRTGHTLARSLGLGTLVLYGLGTIVGAGIYVLVGEVASDAGLRTPLAFVVAGVLAGLTGLSYSELVARLPAAEGSVAFVTAAFGSPILSAVTGAALGLVGVLGGATIALGGAGYVAAAVPLSQTLIAASVVVAFTAIACLHVGNSARFAAALSVIEIGGLAFVIAAGGPALATLPAALPHLVPASAAEGAGLAAGAFIAFYAFLGFESMANMAEETHDATRTVPRAIMAALGMAAALYAVVSLVTVLDLPLATLAQSTSPLLLVVERHLPQVSGTFHAVAVVATLNGVLIEILVVARLAFGMARGGLLPPWFARISPATRAPVRATTVVGAALLALVTAVPFGVLAHLTSGITLAIFVVVNLSLWRLQRRDPRPDLGTRVPAWVPIAGAAACALLLAASVLT